MKKNILGCITILIRKVFYEVSSTKARGSREHNAFKDNPGKKLIKIQ